MSRAPHHYNPDWLDDDALVANFIARKNEFNFLRDELARAPRQGSVQHYLLIGPRGAGKTTLLKRLAIAIRREDQLSDHLIALSFPEELYQVKDLADFWWAACEAMGDELERLGEKARAAKLFDAVDNARATRTASPTDEGLKTLLACASEIKQRPVLLVDNLDLVFERIDKKGRKLKDPLSPAYWALREALSTTTSPIVIGGSVRLSEPFTDYDKAFYDFFLPKRLGKLSLPEVRQVLEHLAEQQQAPEIKTRLHERPARIDALYDLTGGNPRAIGFIFQLLQQGPNSRVVEDFERLMDLTTPYYKARFEDLSEQAQVVMHALATRRPADGSALRFGHTAAEIATHAGLPTNTVSAQMDVLEREGLIEKSAAKGRTQYRIAEQLFRLWLQMRGSRRIRQNVIGLAEFLEAMYDIDEMTAELGKAGYGLNQAQYAFAVAGTRCAASLRHGLEAHATDCLYQAIGENNREYKERLPTTDISLEIATLQRLQAQLAQTSNHGLRPEEQVTLLGSLELPLELKETSVSALCGEETSAAELLHLRTHFITEAQRMERWGLTKEDLERLFKLRTKGFLPLPKLTVGDADAVLKTRSKSTALASSIWHLVGAGAIVEFTPVSALDWLNWGLLHAEKTTSTEWANVAGSLRRSQQMEIAALALEQAFKRGESSRSWYERAAQFYEQDEISDAEAAFLHAAELDPSDALPWHGLAHLLTTKAERPVEAEEVFRKAIAIDPTFSWPWNGLGILLMDKLNRPTEAEEAIRKAIELDPGYAMAWLNLGNLLSYHLNRPNEAEKAYREASRQCPTFAWPWNNLGNLLADELDRPQEAEEAYRKAIEIDPMDALPWNNLGNLLASEPNRSGEAENCFCKAIELDPTYAQPWGELGLLHETHGETEKAIFAYEQAAKLEDGRNNYWQNCRRALLDYPLLEAIKEALQISDLSKLRQSLNELLGKADDLAATLNDEAFVERVLTPVLPDEHKAAQVLGLLWGLGYDKHARPLLLAFEAAVKKRPEALEDLEPEIRGAAQRMYARLTTANTAKST